MTVGAPSGYCRPVEPVNGRMSSWVNHTNRSTPSTEPGVDYYVPVGTPVRAASSGVVSHVGDSVQPATGRFVTVDLDDGRRVRYLHLLRRSVNVGNRVQWGQVIGLSGATGYGEEDWSWNVAGTGGAHVHMTLFRNHSYTFGRYATLDPELYMDRSAAAGAVVDVEKILEDTMSSNPIINVVSKYGVHASNGTIHIGLDDGSFEQMRAPFASNIRGILSVGFLGAEDGSKDKIPTLSQADFNALKGVWATMCKGRTDAAAVWAEGVHAQDADGHGLYIGPDGAITTKKTGRPLKFTAAGYIASTNALANELRDEELNG